MEKKLFQERLTFRLNARNNAVVVFFDGAEIATYFREEKELAFHSRSVNLASDPAKELTEPIIMELVSRGFISAVAPQIFAGKHVSRVIEK